MFKGQVFYHGVIRNTIVAFGSLFSNIKIERKLKEFSAELGNKGDTIQTVDVPIAYAPKEKWIVRVDSDPTLENQVYTTLPRLSFEITSMQYDPTRKLNKMNTVSCVSPDGSRKETYSPVPYNIDISLYAIAKTQEDCLQIIEQILPFFSPEYTLSIKIVPELNIVHDVPVILNSISIQDDYDGDFQTRRFVTYTLTFQLKTNLYGPVGKTGLVKTTNIGISQDPTLSSGQNVTSYQATQSTPTSVIIEGWNDE
jgi:hypothetical protein